MWNLYKKELFSYLHSMLAYVFIAFFVAAGGIYYSHYCLTYALMDYSNYVLMSIVILLIVVVPILTMKLVAEERKQKTDQLLLTSPVKVSFVIIGKYLAAETLFAIALMITAIFPVISGLFGTMNYGALATGFLGYFLMGSALIAVGIFLSSITDNPMIAAALSFGAVLFMFLAESAVQNIPTRPRYTIVFLLLVVAIVAICFYIKSKKTWLSLCVFAIAVVCIFGIYAWKAELYEDGVAQIIAWFSVLARFDDFAGGILNLSSIIYYLSFILVFLFLTIIVFKRETGRQGAVSMSLAGIFIAICLVANVVVTKADFSYDVTSNQMYTISKQTKKILQGLDKEVTIYMLSAKSDANLIYKKILQQYAKTSKNVSLKYKDLEQYPNFGKKYLSDGETATEGSVIVTSGEKGRYVSSNDFVSYSYDYYSGSQYPESLNIEQKVTEAINYVTSDETPMIYELVGHGEISLGSDVTTKLENDNYQVEELNLVTAGKVPEDASMLLINGPQKDFTKDAIKQLKSYMKKGGRLYVLLDPLADELPNLNQFLETYGITVDSGVVIEQDTNYYMQGQPVFLVPEYGYHTITTPLQNDNLFVMLPMAGGLKIQEETEDSDYTVTALLSSTEKSYLKKDLESDITKKAKEDEDGPFVLSAVVEKEEEPQIIVTYCLNQWDSQINQYSGDANLNFFLNGTNYLNQQEDKISVRAKSITTEYGVYTEFTQKVLSTASIYGVPVIVLAIGGVVAYRRRRL